MLFDSSCCSFLTGCETNSSEECARFELISCTIILPNVPISSGVKCALLCRSRPFSQELKAAGHYVMVETSGERPWQEGSTDGESNSSGSGDLPLRVCAVARVRLGGSDRSSLGAIVPSACTTGACHKPSLPVAVAWSFKDMVTRVQCLHRGLEVTPGLGGGGGT